MDIFAKRLKELRLEKGLSLFQLAKELKTSEAALSRYEQKLRIPNIITLTAIAKFFNVSADYLLGLSEF